MVEILSRAAPRLVGLMSNARCLLMSQFEYIDALLAFDDGPTWRSMVEILKQINSPVANVTLRPLYRAAQR